MSPARAKPGPDDRGGIRLKILRRIWEVIEKVIGIYLPCVTFLIMFVSFCIQIICRYLFNYQFEWTYEFTVIGFMWTAVFGACYSSKIRDHVSFNLIYDRLGGKGQALMSLAGNLIIIVAFFLLIPYAVEYISFMDIKTTPVLKLSFGVAYAPFLIFLLFSIIYIIRDIVLAIRTLFGLYRLPKKEDAA